VNGWLGKQAVGTWRRGDVLRGRAVLDELLDRAKEPTREQARLATSVLQRWVAEATHGENELMKDTKMMGQLPRVLIMWKQVKNRRRIVNLSRRRLNKSAEVVEPTVQLLQMFAEAYDVTGNEVFFPTDQCFAITFDTLGLSPNIDHTLEVVQDLLTQCCQHAEKRGRIPDLVCWNAALHAIAKCSPYNPKAPELVEDFIQGLPHSPTVRTWTAALYAWARCTQEEGAPSRAQSILDHLVNEGQATTVAFNLCIDAWSKHGQPAHAEATLHSLLQEYEQATTPTAREALRPSDLSFLAAINSWAKSQDPRAAEKAEELLKHMQRLLNSGEHPGLKVSTQVFSAVLDAWARQPNAGPKVESLLTGMEHLNEVNPDEGTALSLQTYSIAINAWANTNTYEAPERAVKLLHRLEELSSQGNPALIPNAMTYTSAIRAWNKSNRDDAPLRAVSMLNRMWRLAEGARPKPSAVAPNTVTYNVVLHILASHGKIREIQELFNQMREKSDDWNVLPDVVTYGTIMNAYRQSRQSNSGVKASSLLMEMEEKYRLGNAALKPNPTIYSTVLAAWGSSGHREAAIKANEIFWQLVERYEKDENDIVPTQQVCNAALSAWARSDEALAPEQAEKVLRWMKGQRSKHIHPSVVSYNHVLMAWAHSERNQAFSRIKELIEDMESSSETIPDSISYSNLLFAISKSNGPSRARQCLTVVENLLASTSVRSINAGITPPKIAWFHSIFHACLTSSLSERDDSLLVLKEASRILFETKTLQITEGTFRYILKACLHLSVDDAEFVQSITGRCLALGTPNADTTDTIRRVLSD
jgi:pentatricopeptide repeat protein